MLEFMVGGVVGFLLCEILTFENQVRKLIVKRGEKTYARLKFESRVRKLQSNLLKENDSSISHIVTPDGTQFIDCSFSSTSDKSGKIL